MLDCRPRRPPAARRSTQPSRLSRACLDPVLSHRWARDRRIRSGLPLPISARKSRQPAIVVDHLDTGRGAVSPLVYDEIQVGFRCASGEAANEKTCEPVIDQRSRESLRRCKRSIQQHPFAPVRSSQPLFSHVSRRELSDRTRVEDAFDVGLESNRNRRLQRSDLGGLAESGVRRQRRVQSRYILRIEASSEPSGTLAGQGLACVDRIQGSVKQSTIAHRLQT